MPKQGGITNLQLQVFLLLIAIYHSHVSESGWLNTNSVTKRQKSAAQAKS